MQKTAPKRTSPEKTLSENSSCSAGGRSRGRPRAFDRDDALSAAMQLFWRKGYSATSIADLTAAMGIGSPSLYAAFGSKEALYAEALEFYIAAHEGVVWKGFAEADTARDAIKRLLFDSAAGLSETPNGCMVTLSAVGGEGNAELGARVLAARSHGLEQIEARITRGQTAGEIPAAVGVHILARFVQCVQNGMSILARDGATHAELSGVAETAMLGWDERVGLARNV